MNDYSFFSAPQLKRISLGSAFMRDHVYVITRTGQLLAEWWYVSLPLLFLSLLITRRALITQADSVRPTLRLLGRLLIWPALALVAGMIFTDVDQHSSTLPMILMAGVGGLLVANVVHGAVQLWRHRSRWDFVGAALLLELWVCFCVALSSGFTISGIGRHWL